MSTCLNDERIQAVADGEGTTIEIDHARLCTACSVRVADVRGSIADFGRMMADVHVPPMLGARVVRATRNGPAHVGGATTLRDVRRSWRFATAWLVAGGAVATAVIVMLFVVLPTVDRSSTLNASEILNRSLQALDGHGTERLEYELTIKAPGALAVENGTYRIEQLIDHDRGRWRFSRFAPDGTLLNGISENPEARTRDTLLRLDGRTYRFHFTLAAGETLRLWDIQRRFAETMIRLVQASAGQVVRLENDAAAARYVVELPATRSRGNSDALANVTIFDLNHARVVVDAHDFHIVQFSAGGFVMGQDVSVGFQLIDRVASGPQAPDSEFELPMDDPNAIQLEGEGTKHPPHDLVVLLLREIARR